jgi:hypothetical protein
MSAMPPHGILTESLELLEHERGDEKGVSFIP